MTQTSLSYYEKVLKSKVARVRLYPAQDAGAFDCQGAEDRNLLRLHRSCGPAAEKFTIGVVFMNILFFLSPKHDHAHLGCRDLVVDTVRIIRFFRLKTGSWKPRFL